MIRLSAEFNRVRTIDLGDEVTFTFRSLTYTDYEELAIRAGRLAGQIRDNADFSDAMEETRIGDIEAPELIDRIRAIANQILLDSMVARAGMSWTGVFDISDNPLPLNPENWKLFRDLCAYKADQVYHAIRAPLLEAKAEGNASAPSPNGALAGVSGDAPTAR